MEKIKNIIIRYMLSFLSTFMRLIIIVLGGLKLFSEQKELLFAISFAIVLTVYFLNTHLKVVVRKMGNDGFNGFSQIKSLIPTIVLSTLLSLFMSVLLTHCAISLIFDLGSISELKNYIDNSGNNQIRIWFLVFFMIFEITNVLSTVWLIDKEKIIDTKNEELSYAHSTQLRIINSIQHELGNKLPIVHLGFQDLKDVIFKLNAHGEIDIDKPIRDAIGNETVESIDTIRKLLSNIDSGMMNSIIVVENMKSIIRTDSDSLQLTDTDINEFIRSDQGKRTSQFSNVKLHPTNMGNHGLRHKIDQRQFKILLDNIYSNAQLHSFVDKDIQYDFWISLFDWKKEVEIVFQTNGHPFPNDITVEKYTEFNYFSGPNGHSGIGGYLIGQVVNNHNGKISLRARNDLMQSETSITITLPK
jgi:hypothetical protein